MSIQSQKKNMETIYGLLSRDLGYIWGEKESGPNGAKKDFLRKSAAFLRQLGKDLGFAEMRVTTNAGGIAVSGEVTLYGMWSAGNGLCFELAQNRVPSTALMYRETESLTDYRGGDNKWLRMSVFRDGDYLCLCETMLRLKRKAVAESAA